MLKGVFLLPEFSMELEFFPLGICKLSMETSWEAATLVGLACLSPKHLLNYNFLANTPKRRCTPKHWMIALFLLTEALLIHGIIANDQLLILFSMALTVMKIDISNENTWAKGSLLHTLHYTPNFHSLYDKFWVEGTLHEFTFLKKELNIDMFLRT